MKNILLLFFCLAILVACKSIPPEIDKSNSILKIEENENKLLKTIEEFNLAAENAQAGDKLILANGIWKDAELKINKNGTSSKPIFITVEEKGKVFLEGQSNLKIGGSFIHVEGLVFRNGYTPSGSVIAFKSGKENFCNNCRVTECVIDDYNPPERHDSDYWVEIYGKNNRFDHNYLVGKRNRGVTLAVRLKTEASRENNHIIDYNHFGYHPILGSNGGETLRVGTSHYSMSNSNTVVENNYFERCNGELEIISSKSCQNTFNNNTFFECQGTLTMRHGNETLVKNNTFLGNGKPNTGGIRIINETQTVKNNYCEGLTGTRFRAALVIMNGVPNSPLNRYFQVIDSEASNNMIIDCDHIQLCAGSDEERSATPNNTKMNSNIIYNTKKDKVFTIYDDVSGIEFKDNLLSNNMDFPQYQETELKKGFKKQEINLIRENGILSSNTHPHIGPDPLLPRINQTNTGIPWYPKKNYQIEFDNGKDILVKPGENTIYEAVKNSKKGDRIILTQKGKYLESKSIDIKHTLTIIGENELNTKPIITFERSSLFNVLNEGSLSLENLKFSGEDCDDYAGNAVIRTSRYSMINNYKLKIKGCDFENLDVNHSFNVLKVYKNSFADSILVKDCNFKNITGHVFNLDKEFDDIGIYNVENFEMDNCTFENIGGVAINLYRGGRDESTFGPILKLRNTEFFNVGHDKRNKYNAALSIHGVQFAEMENLNFKDSKKVKMHLVVGEPVIKLNNIDFDACDKMTSNSDAYQRSNINVKNAK